MHTFTVSIAGHRAQIHALFASTRDYCARYLSDGPPELTVTVTAEDLPAEQALLRQEALEEGLKQRNFPDPFLERSRIQRKLAEALLEKDVLLLHGSCLALQGRAYLFTAPCGTGKSTHTRLWREAFPETVMINDDKPFLTFSGDTVTAWGAPWSGKHGLDTNTCAPLKGICLLQRGDSDEIAPMDPEALRPWLLTQCPEGAEALLDHLLARVPLWKLTCTKHPTAAQVAHTAMFGN